MLSYGYTWADRMRVPYQPEHTIGASLDFAWAERNAGRAGDFMVSGHYESLRYGDTANLDKLDPYFLLDFSLNQNIEKGMTIFAVLRNALNSSYETFSGYPMPNMSLTFGLRFRYQTRE
jgi:vitamin B12 transporter